MLIFVTGHTQYVQDILSFFHKIAHFEHFWGETIKI